ncbi:MAG TPA: ABC transporter permease [Candidatus Limnocylindrales bacterium]|nr:ABC transporter permease [Candidatus Limnocylindrales bacterium]
MTTTAGPSTAPRQTPPPPSFARRLSGALYRRPRVQLGLLLAAPLGWLLIAYIGSLALLAVSAFWRLDPFSGNIVTEPTLRNFQDLLGSNIYRTVALRTIGFAALVTITDVILAFPIAYFMARLAAPRTRALLVVSILLPLWSGYLVKVYAWRLILSENGLLNWVLAPLGLHGPGYGEIAVWLVMSYLWLPYMIIPIFAGLERIPESLLEASGDLGARSGTTFRRVILPLVFPAVVAGSIFTFSLTLGDYITPTLVSSTTFVGNVISSNVGVAGNQPLAAAYAFVPAAVMTIYLLVARRLGAFEAL